MKSLENSTLHSHDRMRVKKVNEFLEWLYLKQKQKHFGITDSLKGSQGCPDIPKPKFENHCSSSFICMPVFFFYSGSCLRVGSVSYDSVPEAQTGELPRTSPFLNLPKTQEHQQTNCGSPSLES